MSGLHRHSHSLFVKGPLSINTVGAVEAGIINSNLGLGTGVSTSFLKVARRRTQT